MNRRALLKAAAMLAGQCMLPGRIPQESLGDACWDDAGGDVLAAIRAAKAAVERDTGFRPNAVLVGAGFAAAVLESTGFDLRDPEQAAEVLRATGLGGCELSVAG